MARGWLLVTVWFASALAACASPSERAALARDEYQAAMNAGNLSAAKSAMLRAVQAKDDEAISWMGLGRAQIGLGDLSGAYNSYARANELDRGSVEALQVMADLSLLAGRVRDAERYAEQLQLLQPGTASPLTTQGFIALARKKPDLAIEKAEAALSLRPFDPSATTLKARALSTKLQHREGAELLEALINARGPEAAVLSTLLALYRQAGDDGAILGTLARLTVLDPANNDRALEYATELYRNGSLTQARAITLRLAQSGVDRERLEQTLELWAAHEGRAQAVRNVSEVADQAPPSARIQYADFLVNAGRADAAEALMRAQAGFPITAENADASAVLASAQGAKGNLKAAIPMISAVLRFDPTNLFALRARVDLAIAAGYCDRALTDARVLTIENPGSANDRIRLAKCYTIRGNQALAETTYWTAFREIPGSALLYASLKTFLVNTGRSGSVQRLTQRFEEQKRGLAAAAFAKG